MVLANHSFVANDDVKFIHISYSMTCTPGKLYKVLDVGFFSIKVIDDSGVEQWVSAQAFEHIPKVTITKRHLKRVVLGR